MKLVTTDRFGSEIKTEITPATQHQEAVYAVSATKVSGRFYKIAAALAAIAYAICDLADAIRERTPDDE